MTHRELGGLLKKLNIPVAYSHFRETQKPPYMVYVRTGSANIGADNGVWVKRMNYDIVLYTEKRDTALEEKIENLLDGAELFYDIDEIYIDAEKVFAVTYSIQI